MRVLNNNVKKLLDEEPRNRRIILKKIISKIAKINNSNDAMECIEILANYTQTFGYSLITDLIKDLTWNKYFSLLNRPKNYLKHNSKTYNNGKNNIG